MGARVLFIASISTVFLILSNAGFAQDESAGGHVLPTLHVRRPAPHAKRNPLRITEPVAAASTRLHVYPTTPLASGGIEADKVPASLNVVGTSQIEHVGSPVVTDALRQYVPSAT